MTVLPNESLELAILRAGNAVWLQRFESTSSL
jgi:hypothetical protein